MTMDRDLSPDELRPLRLRRMVRIAVPLVLGIVLLVALPGWLRPSLRRADLRFARVERGTIEGSFTAEGRVVPAFEKVLSSPVEARVLRLLRRPGDRVAAGEPVLELDLGSLRLDREREQEQLAQKNNEAARERIRLAGELAGYTDRQEEARLDQQLLTYRLEQTRRLRAEGLAAEDTLRQAEVAASKAALEVTRLARERETARRQGEANMQALELEARVLAQGLAVADAQLEQGTARADRAGVVTWVVAQEGATIGRGAPIARVADLSAYGVEATVSDVHASALRPGLPARVALSDGVLDGTVEAVFPTIEEAVVRFRVALATPADRRLRNNLRVDVDVVTERRPGVLTLPRGGALQGGRQDLFVVRGDRAVRKTIELGVSGPRGWEVRSGLAEGDEVILSDLSDYSRIREIRIR